ncbi:MAG: HAMP domain-containing sensor histidine kinase [Pseudomonadota bacterium]
MKFNWTLKKELGLFLILQVLILVAVYSYLLPYYLWTGIQQAAQVFLETEAKQLAAQIEQGHPVRPNNLGRGIEAYVGFDALPENIKKFYEDRLPLRDKRLYMRGYFEEPDGDDVSIMLMPYDLADGRQLITVFGVRDSVLERQGGAIDRLDDYLELTGILGVGFLLLWGLLTAVLLHRIAQRTRRMSQWTRSLSPGREHNNPSFGYHEFDEVGMQLKDAFDTISRALERETEFVRNASHELRTPISIIRSNLDVLSIQANGNSEPHARIQRATSKMQELVDALLWLSREDPKLMAREPVDVGATLQQTIEDHDALMRGKNLVVQDNRRSSVVELPPAALAIVLSNLIRNAFDHASTGSIRVQVNDDSVSIENQVDEVDGYTPVDGLGITLVRKIADRLGWRCSFQNGTQGYVAELVFHPPQQPVG